MPGEQKRRRRQRREKHRCNNRNASVKAVSKSFTKFSPSVLFNRKLSPKTSERIICRSNGQNLHTSAPATSERKLQSWTSGQACRILDFTCLFRPFFSFSLPIDVFFPYSSFLSRGSATVVCYVCPLLQTVLKLPEGMKVYV